MTEQPRQTRNPRPETSLADDLGELLRLVGRSDVEEIEVQHDETRFRIRRDLTGPRSAPAPAAETPDRAASSDGYVITSPLVGVFRRATGTGTETPLEAGQEIAVGQAIGAVEAMRMLNRIQSERAGIVEEVFVHEGQPVEYGQPLLVLRAP